MPEEAVPVKTAPWKADGHKIVKISLGLGALLIVIIIILASTLGGGSGAATRVPCSYITPELYRNISQGDNEVPTFLKYDTSYKIELVSEPG